MENVNVADFGSTEKPTGNYSYRLSSPMQFLWTMVLFLVIVGFIAAILFRQAQTAFMHNPGLNGLILGVLGVGIILVFAQVLALRPEVRWFNSFRAAGSVEKVGRDPKLLAPMRVLLGNRKASGLSTATFRSILDSIANRLDESRDVSRYLIGLLVFLGLLGTFWGLIGTIGSISNVIQSLDAGTNGSSDVLGALKEGLSTPLSGMGQAFSSSLLGLSGSLILGFLDLQAGRAQNRFYVELENWLSSVTDVGSDVAVPTIDGKGSVSPDDVRALSEYLRKVSEEGGAGSQRSVAAMASLAEGIQGLVKNMRNEQQMLRDWIEAQQDETKAMRRTLDRLAERIGSQERLSTGGGSERGPRMPQAETSEGK
ncbi:flagellar motor protein MotA [Rhizobium grahamii]|uniref:Flagellar motor protein MotA n=1 Tax=Rhizobium grahamii TaxID=1120045 RepID=A0A5Q0C6Y2_9HYPH|nr:MULTISPECIES: flagellar motor protein MotA [Rhizobium]QFY61252.1 flagellar motor protein MotA [Rhizobium grahamii]QRM49597.1 flagellar motor protein MotA [Rhizobium sp. BG6]